MRIVVATYMHKRIPMYKVHAMGVKRMVRDFGVIPVVVCSKEFPERDLIEKELGFNYHEHPNKPLGAKANFTSVCASLHDPDYVIFLDSDDIISNRVMEEYIHYMKKGVGVLGVKDLYFYGLHPRRGRYGIFGYWHGYGPRNRATGIAKCVSREIMEKPKVDWMPFNRRVNSGLDGTMRAKTGRYKPWKEVISLKDINGMAIDIKTGGNINGFCNFPIEIMDMEKTISKHLPGDEVEAIINLRDHVFETKKPPRRE